VDTVAWDSTAKEDYINDLKLKLSVYDSAIHMKTEKNENKWELVLALFNQYEKAFNAKTQFSFNQSLSFSKHYIQYQDTDENTNWSSPYLQLRSNLALTKEY